MALVFTPALPNLFLKAGNNTGQYIREADSLFLTHLRIFIDTLIMEIHHDTMIASVYIAKEDHILCPFIPRE